MICKSSNTRLKEEKPVSLEFYRVLQVFTEFYQVLGVSSVFYPVIKVFSDLEIQ